MSESKIEKVIKRRSKAFKGSGTELVYTNRLDGDRQKQMLFIESRDTKHYHNLDVLRSYRKDTGDMF